MNDYKSKTTILRHSELCGRKGYNKGYGKRENDNLFSIPSYTNTSNTTQSTERNRRLNETASKIPSGLLKCASRGRWEKISPPFIRIAERRGIDKGSAIALLERARMGGEA